MNYIIKYIIRIGKYKSSIWLSLTHGKSYPPRKVFNFQVSNLRKRCTNISFWRDFSFGPIMRRIHFFLFFLSSTSKSGCLMTVLDKSYFLATGITLSVCSKDHSHPISTNSTLNETVLHSGMSKKAFWILTKVEPKGSHTLIGGPADQSGFRNSEVRSESLKICWNCKMGAVLISIFFLYNSSA